MILGKSTIQTYCVNATIITCIAITPWMFHNHNICMHLDYRVESHMIYITYNIIRCNTCSACNKRCYNSKLFLRDFNIPTNSSSQYSTRITKTTYT